MTEEYLTATDVARMMECSTRQLKQYRRDGVGPRHTIVKGRAMYRADDWADYVRSARDGIGD